MNSLERTLTSNEVAEMVGRRHDQVLRDIATIISHLADHKSVVSYFIESTYKSEQNKNLPNYLLTKKGCELYSTRINGPRGTQFAVTYIERFNQMENHIKEQQKLPQSPMEVLKLMFDAQTETNNRVETLEINMREVKENQSLSPGEYSYISRRINQRVSEVARSFGPLTTKQRAELYKDINQGVKQVTGISTRTQLRDRHFQTALDFIQDWEPSTATKMIVRQTALELEAGV